MREKGVQTDQIPWISFSIGETELKAMGVEDFVGDYAAWNYFQGLSNLENLSFVDRFKKKYGWDRVTGDPIESAYISVKLWAKAVEMAGLESPEAVKEHLKGQSFQAPEGQVKIDIQNQHLWKTARIGKILPDGQFQIIWDSGEPIQPFPFPATRKISEWKLFLHSRYLEWDRNWYNPGDAFTN